MVGVDLALVYVLAGLEPALPITSYASGAVLSPPFNTGSQPGGSAHDRSEAAAVVHIVVVVFG